MNASRLTARAASLDGPAAANSTRVKNAWSEPCAECIVSECHAAPANPCSLMYS
jgi:hypothetical protein